MSYLADVKSKLRGIFDEAFEYAWKDVVEPALKESYRNGVEAGRAGQTGNAGEASPTPRRSWGKRSPGKAGAA